MVNTAGVGGGRDDGAEGDDAEDDSKLGAAEDRKMNIVETSINHWLLIWHKYYC